MKEETSNRLNGLYRVGIWGFFWFVSLEKILNYNYEQLLDGRPLANKYGEFLGLGIYSAAYLLSSIGITDGANSVMLGEKSYFSKRALGNPDNSKLEKKALNI